MFTHGRSGFVRFAIPHITIDLSMEFNRLFKSVAHSTVVCRLSYIAVEAALPKKSAQPTTDSSPPIHRWDQRDQERQSVKRTAESGRVCQSRIYQSSVSRTGAARDCLPQH